MPKLLSARVPENAEEERKIRKLVGGRHAPGGCIRALLPRARRAWQEDHRVGRPGSVVGKTLVSGTQDHSRGRWHLRRFRTARPLP